MAFTACCKGCEDRTVEPNCHMTCERYLAAQFEADQAKKEKYKDAGTWIYNEYRSDARAKAVRSHGVRRRKW